MANELFHQNMEILKNGVYGKDVRQAIYNLFQNHAGVLIALESAVNNATGGEGGTGGGSDTTFQPSVSQNGMGYNGRSVCGTAFRVYDGCTTQRVAAIKF